ncbi:MAG: CoA transferase [Dehalococcoidia bacterium]|nr:CoA transferase [Dehalococcoidia bacterium]
MRTDALAGLRVIELGAFWAGPYCARMLADLGAEVIKVEAVRRPDMVRFGLYPDADPGEVPWERGAHYQKFSRNKKSCVIDISQPRGHELFLRLLAISDVFLENNTPRVRLNLGLDDDTVRKANPKLITLSMPGFGLDGPYRDYLAYGITIEGFVGLTSVTGYPDDPEPIRSAVPYGDPVAGMYGVIAILAALRRVRAGGDPGFIELAQNETLATLMPDIFLQAQATGVSPTPTGNQTPDVALQQAFVASDGEWVAITVPEPAGLPALASVVGGPAANVDELRAATAAWCAARPAAVAADALQGAGIGAAPVLSPRQLMEHEQVNAMGIYEPVSHPLYRDFRYSRMPLRFPGAHTEGDRHAPLFGEHNDYVFRDLLGLTEPEIAELHALNITSTQPELL